MASLNVLKALACLALSALFLAQGALGWIVCESLDSSTCTFAVSSLGARCVLEKRVRRGGQLAFSCRTSTIEAEKNLKGWIETDECIAACRLNRNTMGISSDSLLDRHFVQKLCSPGCCKGCPNIADLYFNLAAGEGILLNKLCEQYDSLRIAPVAAGPESGSSEKGARAAPSVEYAADGPALPPSSGI